MIRFEDFYLVLVEIEKISSTSRYVNFGKFQFNKLAMKKI